MEKFVIAICIIVFIIIAVVLIAVILAVKFSKNEPFKWENSYEPFKWESSIERKGRIGEEYVHNILAQAIRGTDAKLISNYIFQGASISVQIDHIVINRNGVYVIETKNYSGYIFGEEKDKEWTQVLSNGNKKNKFRNPIKQNNGHIYQLKKMLPQGTPFYSIVVMAQGNIENITAGGVVAPSGLPYALKRNNSGKSLTSAQIEKIYDILLQRELTGEGVNEQHVSEVNQMLADVERNICPRCKGQLVVREGKYGMFYGCSNYPKCTFKKNID